MSKFEAEDSIQEFTPKKSKKFSEDKKDNWIILTNNLVSNQFVHEFKFR
jgi:hypothetical protein